MNSGLKFVDDDQVQYSRLAKMEIEPEILDHIIQQTETFLKNLEVAAFVDENQTLACMPDGREVSIKDMKETFFQYAPSILIQLAYRIKYLQGNGQ